MFSIIMSSPHALGIIVISSEGIYIKYYNLRYYIINVCFVYNNQTTMMMILIYFHIFPIRFAYPEDSVISIDTKCHYDSNNGANNNLYQNRDIVVFSI